MKHDPTAVEPPRGFEDVFGPTSGVADLIRRAFERAYDDACEDYDPDGKGADAFLFGSTIYTYARHRLVQEIEARGSELEMELLSLRPRFVFRVGRFEVSFYRVGERADESIETSLPRNRKGAPQMVEPELVLPGLEDYLHHVPDVHGVSRLLLAHHGNPDDGLQALHVCIPIRFGDEQLIRQWAFARQLWAAQHSEQFDVPVPTQLPDEVVDEPVVRRRSPESESDDGKQ